MSCNASGCPIPITTWKKKGNSTFYHVGERIIFSTLVLHDHGEYICSATAPGKSVNRSGILTILCKYVKFVYSRLPRSLLHLSFHQKIESLEIHASCADDR